MMITTRRLVLAVLVCPFYESVARITNLILPAGWTSRATGGTFSNPPAVRWGTPADAAPFLLTLGATALYWLVAWWSVIRWNGARVSLTILALPIALGAALAYSYLGSIPRSSGGYFTNRMVAMNIHIAVFTFLFVTSLVWLKPNGGSLARTNCAGAGPLRCPTCGYDMSALKQSCCPECGADHTIGSLVAAQTESELAESPPAASAGRGRTQKAPGE